MSVLSARDIIGIEGVPASRMGIWKWLRRLSIPLTQYGKRFTFHLSDLPEPVRLAYQVRQAERSGLAAGVQDEAAHLGLMAKPMCTQKRAHDRAAILAIVAKHRQAGEL